MSLTLYFDTDTSRALEAFRRACGGIPIREAADKAMRLTDAVLSIERQGYKPCLYTSSGTQQVITLSSFFTKLGDGLSHRKADDVFKLTFDDSDINDLKRLRQHFEERGMLKKNDTTLGETLEAVADISSALVRTMRQDQSDLARLDHRNQMIPVVIYGHHDLHALNVKPFSPKP